MKLKTIVFAVLGVAAAWYGLKAYAAVQKQKHLQTCVHELKLLQRVKAARSSDEIRQMVVEQVDCLDRKMRFPASLFFNKSYAEASITIH